MPNLVTPTPAMAALAGALAVHLELLGWLRRRDRPPWHDNPPWWFGYARDGANLCASLLFWGAYLLVGYSGAVALCAAMLTTLGCYLLDWLVARALELRRPRLALALPFAAWVAFVGVWPHSLGVALGRLIVSVQPR